MYATVADMIAVFGETFVIDLTDRALPRSGAIDSTVAGRALSDATALIDGYLTGRYTLPLTPVPATFLRMCCDLAAHALSSHPTDQLKERRAEIIRYLELVAAGKVPLGVDAADQRPAALGGPAVSAPDRVFQPGAPGDFWGANI